MKKIIAKIYRDGNEDLCTSNFEDAEHPDKALYATKMLIERNAQSVIVQVKVALKPEEIWLEVELPSEVFPYDIRKIIPPEMESNELWNHSITYHHYWSVGGTQARFTDWERDVGGRHLTLTLWAQVLSDQNLHVFLGTHESVLEDEDDTYPIEVFTPFAELRLPQGTYLLVNIPSF